MQKHLLISLSFIMLLTSALWGQRVTVNGTVSDDVTGETLPGVSIIIEGTTLGTTTDINGSYSIDVNRDDVLLFSFVGYLTQRIEVADKTIINVAMPMDVIGLEEFVIVGYGVQSRASVVASIAQTTGDHLLSVGDVSNVSQALQGMLPGITAITTTGKPGADQADIFIRGRASWQETQPLVLVDGIERDMNDVDPNEIETLSVLKDASATAVFGVKGANGVILITTKRGRVAPPSISFSTNLGFKAPTTGPEFADYVTSMEMRNESLANDRRWNDQIPDAIIETWRENIHQAGPYNDYFPHIDWWDKMIKDFGHQYRFNINVRGGSEFLRYFASLSYLNDGDIFETTPADFFDPSFKFERYNFRSNFDFAITRTTEISLNLSGMVSYRNQTGYRIDGSGWGEEQFFQRIYDSGQNEFPIKWSDGEWAIGPDGTGNLIADFDMGQRIYRTYRGFADAELTQDLGDFIEGLNFKGRVSFNATAAHQSQIQRYGSGNFGEQFPVAFSREYDLLNPNDDGTYNMTDERRWPGGEAQNPPPSASYDNIMTGGFGRYLYYEMALNYARSFGKHNVSGLALFSRSADEGLQSWSTGLIKIPERREDWVGRVTYNWDQRYLFEFNAAYNGSEKFAPGLRFGLFPSVSMGWRLSEEQFIKRFAGEYLDNLLVRASWGTSGVDRGARRFAYIQPFNTGGNVSLGLETPSSYGPLFFEGGAANPNATWETSEKQNLGVNIGLLQKLTIEIDVFKERRTGILMNIWSPLWLGIAEASGNVGETKNRGAEIEADWRDHIGSNFRYRVATGFAFTQNMIVFRGDGLNMDEYLMNAGKPIGWQSRLLQYAYYESLCDIFNYATPNNTSLQGGLVPGDFMFIDYNGDGVIDDNDRVAMRNVNYPLNTYSLTLGFGYGAFDVHVMFYAASSFNKNVDSRILWDLNRAELGIYKAGPDVVDRWTPSNADDAVKPALHATSSIRNYSQSASSYGYQDASYIRLKVFEMSYNVPNPGKLGLKRLQVYTNGNNLLTWTKLDKRIDPESAGAGVYPLVRRFNIGVRAAL